MQNFVNIVSRRASDIERPVIVPRASSAHLVSTLRISAWRSLFDGGHEPLERLVRLSQRGRLPRVHRDSLAGEIARRALDRLVEYPGSQILEPFPLERRDGDHVPRAEPPSRLVERVSQPEIALVEHAEKLVRGDPGDFISGFVRDLLAPVDDEQNEVRIERGRSRDLDSLRFDLAARLGDAGRILEAAREAADVDPLAKNISRRSGDGGDDRPLFAEERVVEAALPDVAALRESSRECRGGAFPRRSRIRGAPRSPRGPSARLRACRAGNTPADPLRRNRSTPR